MNLYIIFILYSLNKYDIYYYYIINNSNIEEVFISISNILFRLNLNYFSYAYIIKKPINLELADKKLHEKFETY